MSGSDEEGDYTLDIDSVTLEDDAKFQCQVGHIPRDCCSRHNCYDSYKVNSNIKTKVGAAPGGVEPIRSRYSFLTVTGRLTLVSKPR